MINKIDKMNARILELLQKDARTSVSELARVLSRAESTVRERIALLERRGFITAYRAELNPQLLGYGVHAILRADCDMRFVSELAHKLRAIPNVIRSEMTTGEKPLRIELLADDFPALEKIVQGRIAPLGVKDLEIGLVVQTLVAERPMPLPVVEREAAPILATPKAEPVAMVTSRFADL